MSCSVAPSSRGSPGMPRRVSEHGVVHGHDVGSGYVLCGSVQGGQDTRCSLVPPGNLKLARFVCLPG
jgi:hypothetical protein